MKEQIIEFFLNWNMTAFQIWMSIIGGIILFNTCLYWIIRKFINDTPINNGYYSTSIVLSVISCVIMGIYCCGLYHYKQKTNPGIVKYELISLENSKSMEGNISGSGSFLGHSFSGHYGPTTHCTFIIKDSGNRITIKNVSPESVIFYETEGEPRIESKNDQWTYPFRKDNKTTWYYPNNTQWVIWIPSKEINRYIKFN